MRFVMGEIVITQKHPNGKEGKTIILRNSMSLEEFIAIVAKATFDLLRFSDPSEVLPKIIIDPKRKMEPSPYLERILRAPTR
ncbi:MAG: hypothetical protein M1528_01130 [Candidatus Marsarchaeota archaeon]|nr:hypothetical protein [Candidatus Marsarchaeota archaeon]